MFCEGVYIAQDSKRLIILAQFETSPQRHDGNATPDRSKPVSWMIVDAIRSTSMAWKSEGAGWSKL